jgi:protein involved in polysaccharide export with SLBB domain
MTRVWPALMLALLAIAGTLAIQHAARAQGAPGQEGSPSSSSEGGLPGENSEERHTTTSGRVLAGPIDASAYVVGPGDVLSIEYGGRASGSTSLVVDSEGRVKAPSVGLVVVGGRTLEAVRADLIKRLQPFMPGATLDLRLIEPRSFKVYVLGEVRQPGVVEVVGSARVFEVITAAGGVDSTASTRNIAVVRRNGETVSADLDRFRHTGAWDANPYLQDGDRVMVPIVASRFGVFGAVTHAGTYEYRAGDSLATALEFAGVSAEFALLDSIEVLRFRGASHLDTLIASFERGDRALPLQPDDRIYVRGRPDWRPRRQVTISGEVHFPGPYAISEGAHRLSDLVRWSGGFTPQAAPRNVRLVRDNHGSQAVDPEFDRLSRLTRAEMTNTEYQTFRSKLAVRQSSYLIDFSSGVPVPPEADVLLRDGDHVDVGRIELAVRVDGSVQNPGLVAYTPGRSVGDYVRLAGGPSHRGNINDARVTHAGSGSTLFARDVRTLEPGDFIWVPEKKDTDFWAIFRDVIIIAGQVATVVLVVHQLSH